MKAGLSRRLVLGLAAALVVAMQCRADETLTVGCVNCGEYEYTDGRRLRGEQFLRRLDPSVVAKRTVAAGRREQGDA